MPHYSWIRLVFSALVNGCITTITAVLSAVSQGPLSKNVLWIASLGGLLAFCKDVQAYVAEPPRQKDAAQ